MISKDQFKTYLTDDLGIQLNSNFDHKIKQISIKYSDLINCIDKKNDFTNLNYKPNNTDFKSSKVMGFTPSLTSFQNKNLCISGFKF